jgi:TrmH RNA methyltransferase
MNKNNRQKDEEMIVPGIYAAQKALEKRGDDFLRLFVTKESMSRVKSLVRFAVENKRPYHIVTVEELEKISGTSHHQGVVLVSRKRELSTLKKEEGFILALEDVSNPHNVGAIIRSAAHFGVSSLLGEKAGNFFSAAALRTSQGGSESLNFISANSFLDAILELKRQGYTIIGTSGHSDDSRLKNLFSYKWAPKSVLVMGAESIGMGAPVTKACDVLLTIPGTGAVESLNVTAATTVFLADFFSKKK